MVNTVVVWLHILVDPCWYMYVCMLHCSGVDTNNALPDDGLTVTPKHVGAVLMQILILFLRQTLVHRLVNK